MLCLLLCLHRVAHSALCLLPPSYRACCVWLTQGLLSRAARFKNVDRYCFLFTDMFVFSMQSDKKSVDKSGRPNNLEMKQVVDLNALSIDDRVSVMGPCFALPSLSCRPCSGLLWSDVRGTMVAWVRDVA